MNLKYWQWESHELSEKKRKPSVKDVAFVLEGNETHAYRLARVLCIVKRRGTVRLKDMPPDLPKATWHRYLEQGYRLGLFNKREGNIYEMTNRFSTPLRNFADYYDKWAKAVECESEEELALMFPQAEKGRYSEKGKEGEQADAKPLL